MSSSSSSSSVSPPPITRTGIKRVKTRTNVKRKLACNIKCDTCEVDFDAGVQDNVWRFHSCCVSYCNSEVCDPCKKAYSHNINIACSRTNIEKTKCGCDCCLAETPDVHTNTGITHHFLCKNCTEGGVKEEDLPCIDYGQFGNAFMAFLLKHTGFTTREALYQSAEKFVSDNNRAHPQYLPKTLTVNKETGVVSINSVFNGVVIEEEQIDSFEDDEDECQEQDEDEDEDEEEEEEEEDDKIEEDNE